MHSLEHQLNISASPDVVYRALSTAEGLSGWFTTDVSGSGEVGERWSLGFGEGLGFVWEVEASQPDRIVAWACLEGPGDAPDTTVIFRLQAREDGRTALHFTHRGWPHTSGNFTKCNTLWGGLLHRLKGYAETGSPRPLYG